MNSLASSFFSFGSRHLICATILGIYGLDTLYRIVHEIISSTKELEFDTPKGGRLSFHYERKLPKIFRKQK